ncbi:MAG: hypothetical protein GX550_00400 [Syntrophomonadaceae bacterium]|nr:hypothetical protein [Syntrophomonadaceae bacterium]
MKTKGLILSMVLILAIVISGCEMDIKQLPGFTRADTQEELIKVDIVFTDGQSLRAYVRSLGINSQSRVFVGGSSVSYFYNQQGEILGSYNYQRVLYMKIVPEEEL